jgi:hypothetical protein
MHRLSPTARTAALLLLYLTGFVWFSTWQALTSTRETDSRAYHYAVQLAARGENPFDLAAAESIATELTGRALSLTPYLYPPPSLVALSWMKPLTHEQSFVGLIALGHICLFGLLWMVHRAGGRWWLMAGLIGIWSPIHNTFEKGQVSVLILLSFAAVLLARSPVGVAAGALGKVTPAGMVAWMARLRQWRGIGRAAAVAAILYVPSLLWIPWEWHLDYFQRVLPALASGHVERLGVLPPDEVTLNHSLGQMVRWIPGLSAHQVLAELSIKLALVAIWFRRPMREPWAGAGALIVLLTVFPAIVWEPHFVYLLLPAWVAVESWAMLGRRWRALLVVSVVGCAVHSDWTEPIQWYFPELTPLWQIHKQLAALGLFSVCVHRMAAERSVYAQSDRASETSESPPRA